MMIGKSKFLRCNDSKIKKINIQKRKYEWNNDNVGFIDEIVDDDDNVFDINNVKQKKLQQLQPKNDLLLNIETEEKIIEKVYKNHKDYNNNDDEDDDHVSSSTINSICHGHCNNNNNIQKKLYNSCNEKFKYIKTPSINDREKVLCPLANFMYRAYIENAEVILTFHQKIIMNIIEKKSHHRIKVIATFKMKDSITGFINLAWRDYIKNKSNYTKYLVIYDAKGTIQEINTILSL